MVHFILLRKYQCFDGNLNESKGYPSSPVAADDGHVATSFDTQPDNAVFPAIALRARTYEPNWDSIFAYGRSEVVSLRRPFTSTGAHRSVAAATMYRVPPDAVSSRVRTHSGPPRTSACRRLECVQKIHIAKYIA